jgi:RNA polymerase sigma-70 factor (ECF subfamily)
MRVASLATAATIAALCSSATGTPFDDLSISSAPPVVVKTVPEAGSAEVDPNLAEIRVTFSKEMTEGSWSWSNYSPGNAPRVVGKPRFADDKRTCILPVKLEPGHAYAMWLNSPRFQNFKDADKRPAVPYLLVFETKG